MNKGQTTFFAKALVLVASVVVFAIIIANTQSFFGGTVEKKQRSMFEIGVTATAQKLITTKECLAYSFNNTVEKGVLDIKKIEEFSKNYKNEEPYCAPAYPFDYSIEIRQIPTNFSIYPKMSGPSVGVMLVLDESGSMDCCQHPGYRGSRLYKKCCGEKEIMEPIDELWEEKLSDFKIGSNAFINALEEDDKVGLVTYSSTVKRFIAPTINHQQILNAIERIRPWGGTDIGGAIKKASSFNPDAIVLLSDGCPDGPKIADSITETEEACKGKNITIFTIGYSEDVQRCTPQNPARNGNTGEELLKKIADISKKYTGKGEYYYAPNRTELESIYKQIIEDLPVPNPPATQNISVPLRSWSFGIEKNFSTGMTDFSPEDSQYDKITISLPVTIRYNTTDTKRGMIYITAVDGELERIGSIMNKICSLVKNNETIKKRERIYLHHPVYYENGKLCMKTGNHDPCKNIKCDANISFENTNKEGEYDILFSYDPITRTLQVDT